jgi:hypothetical protein
LISNRLFCYKINLAFRAPTSCQRYRAFATRFFAAAQIHKAKTAQTNGAIIFLKGKKNDPKLLGNIFQTFFWLLSII